MSMPIYTAEYPGYEVLPDDLDLYGCDYVNDVDIYRFGHESTF